MAIVGAGPIGLAALLTAQFYSPAEIIMIDLDDNRLEVARRFGATAYDQQRRRQCRSTKVMALTGGRGVDTAIEAVGVPATFVLCEEIVAPGGTIANVGVHGTKVDLHLETLWSHNITITTRLVDTVTTPMLLKTVQSKKLDPKRLITHRFKLDADPGRLRHVRPRRRARRRSRSSSRRRATAAAATVLSADQHRHRAERKHARCLAPQDHLRQAASPMRGHHDEVAVPVLGRRDDPFRRKVARVHRLARDTGVLGSRRLRLRGSGWRSPRRPSRSRRAGTPVPAPRSPSPTRARWRSPP